MTSSCLFRVGNSTSIDYRSSYQWRGFAQNRNKNKGEEEEEEEEEVEEVEEEIENEKVNRELEAKKKEEELKLKKQKRLERDKFKKEQRTQMIENRKQFISKKQSEKDLRKGKLIPKNSPQEDDGDEPLSELLEESVKLKKKVK